ncbi:related to C2 domain [Lecanosticta acicola]|uniref:Related to C2 domain n=1 Tax=Lecanosticta acicola TaxID=111012 RepID=A0AAI9EBM9_9PEZI|nr:related to C2 domain [Lecanosticta acicola]
MSTTEHAVIGSAPAPAQAALSEKAQQHDADTAETNGKPAEAGKQEEQHQKSEEKQDNGKEEKKPSGGFDATPIPSRPAGYTIKIKFHRAENLPVADINGFSSDPYCLAQLNCDTPKRHKEDPPLRWRSATARKNLEPEWNEEWIVANVPSSGFKLKIRVYDEDPADHDDMLGKVHITVPSIHDGWHGIEEEGYRLQAREGSRRAYLIQALTTCFRANKAFHGHLFVSIEVLGRTQEDGQNGRVYTVGPCRWVRHFSPMLGRLVNIKEPDSEESRQQPAANGRNNGQSGSEQKKAEKYNFQANQFQLEGPVPAELYHRYVEFKPWVSRMFTKRGLTGMVIGSALHHQHARVYNFGRSTEWGHFPEGPSEKMTRQFLDLVHYDQGGRIFTYIISLDALWRFTETGKEFGIDMLSKHTMHSDVSIYIAFSGEFFIRRLKHPRRPPPPEPVEESSQSHPPEHQQNEEHPPKDLSNGPPEDDPPRDPSHYELVIDNDSGTYRPNADLLPLLKQFLAHNLPGIHILTLDCGKDAERQQQMKKEQRERKQKEGDHIVYMQGSRSSSISSSDEEDLDRIQAGLIDEGAVEREHGVLSHAAKDAKLTNRSRMDKAKRDYMIKRGGRGEDANLPATSSS